MNTLSTDERKRLLNVLAEVEDLVKKCQPLYGKYEKLDHQKEEGKDAYVNTVIAKRICIAVAVGFLLFCIFTWDIMTKESYLYVGLPIFPLTVFFCVREYNWKKEWPGLLKEYKTRMQALLDQIDELYDKSPVKCVYPQRYIYAEAADYCYEMIENMRADSIKEAINLYEDERYKARMEAMQKSSLKAQREAAQLLNSIEMEAKKTRKAAQFAAVASVITAYDTHKIKKKIV